MKNKKSVSMRGKQKMSKTRKNKKTKNTTKKIGGSANGEGNKNKKTENKELHLLYGNVGKLESELLDIKGTINAIETGQHLDPNKSIDYIRKKQQNIENNIVVLNEQIKKKENAWNKKADEILLKATNNAIRRSKPNHVGVMGGTTLLLIGVVGVVFAVVKTK